MIDRWSSQRMSTDGLPVISIEDASLANGELQIRGHASVYEGTLFVSISSEGKASLKQQITASRGAPERGEFAMKFPVRTPTATVVVAPEPMNEGSDSNSDLAVQFSLTSEEDG